MSHTTTIPAQVPEPPCSSCSNKERCISQQLACGQFRYYISECNTQAAMKLKRVMHDRTPTREHYNIAFREK